MTTDEIGRPDPRPSSPAPVTEPSQDLLERASAGWERFLDTFEEASGE